MTLKDSDILDLPDLSDIEAPAPVYTPEELFRLCEPLLPYWNTIRYARTYPQCEPPGSEPFQLYDEEDDIIEVVRRQT
jgi:hypothetical protein